MSCYQYRDGESNTSSSVHGTVAVQVAGNSNSSVSVKLESRDGVEVDMQIIQVFKALNGQENGIGRGRSV